MKETPSWARRGGAALGALVAVAVVADLLLGRFTVLAGAVEHVLIQAVVWPFVLADSMGVVMHTPRYAALQWALLAPLTWWLARSADSGNRTSQIQLQLVLGAPLLLLAVAVTAVGLSAGPAVTVGCLLAGAFGSVAAQTGNESSVRSPGSELPEGRARIPVVMIALGVLCFGASYLVPGGARALEPWALADGVPAFLWPWVVGAVGLGGLAWAWPESTAESRAGAPLSRVAAAALFGGFVTLVIVGWSAPDARLLRLVSAIPLIAVASVLGAWLVFSGRSTTPRFGRPLAMVLSCALPLMASSLGLLHVAATGAVDCGSRSEHPALRVVGGEPVRQVAGVDGVVWSVGRDGLRRGGNLVDLGDGEAELTLTVLSEDEGRAVVWGERPDGTLVGMAFDGERLVARGEVESGCELHSWAPGAGLLGVATCAWGNRLVVDEGGLRWTEVTGASGIDQMVGDPSGSSWLGVDRWAHPRLLRIDRVSRRVTAEVFVGPVHGELAADVATGEVGLTRPLQGQLQLVDAGSLQVTGSVRAEGGLSRLVATRWGWLAAAPGPGWLVAVNRDRNVAGRLRIPGVRDLSLLDESTLLLGGQCGTATLDIKSWLEGS